MTTAPNVGDTVTILPPFTPFFPGTYTVASVDVPGNSVQLEGVDSAFDFSYIQEVTP